MKKEFNYFDHEGDSLKDVSLHAADLKKPEQHNIFEAASVSVSDASTFADQQIRSQAMSAALTFVEGEDYSYGALADIVSGINDMDPDSEDTEPTDEQNQEFTDLMTAVGYAFLALGADQDNVNAFLDGESDEEGAKLGAFLSNKLQESTADDDTLITNYAVGGDMVLESMIKVIRGGKLTLKKKRIGKPKKRTSAQKAALRAARRKAFSGAAKRARLKSMSIRRKRGL